MFNYYKIIVAGGRDFSNYDLLSNKLISIQTEIWKNDIADDIEIVSGCARGADTLAIKWAKEYSTPLKLFPADWETHKKAAGPIRNRQMGDYADALIAFWDGESRGTKHMIEYAQQKHLPVMIVRY